MFHKNWMNSKLLNAPFGEGKVRKIEGKVLLPLTRLVKYLGFTPDTLTIIGLCVQGVVGLLLANGFIVLAGWGLVVVGLFDMLDGSLARLTNRASLRGAFLDSIFDQCGDLLVFSGLLWLYLNTEPSDEIILIFLALFGSMLNSHARSRGGMLGIKVKVGFMTRAERFPIMIIGFVLNQVTIVLWLMVILNYFSAFQRAIFVWHALSDDNSTES